MKQHPPNKRRGPPDHSGLAWFELHFPHDLKPAEVVKALQPLAYRPLVGWFKDTLTPLNSAHFPAASATGSASSFSLTGTT